MIILSSFSILYSTILNMVFRYERSIEKFNKIPKNFIGFILIYEKNLYIKKILWNCYT